MDRDRVRREYRELSLQTQRLRAARDSELHPSAVHPLNKNKNRYPDVLPVEETRIRLSKVGEIPHSDYINANLVRSDEKFSAICSQAPLPHTFDDFWRMVWEQDVPIIVILMRLREQGKVKGHHYWPTSKSKPKVYGDIVVSLKKAKQVEETRVRVFELTRKIPMTESFSTRRVVQLHFKGWPDQGVPESTQPIRELVHLMQFYRRKASARSLDGPALIHCSAGIGRTGTFLAIVFSLEKMMKRNQQQRQGDQSRRLSQDGEDDVESSSTSDGAQDPHASTSSDDEARVPLPRRLGSDPHQTEAITPPARRSLRRSSSENSLRSPRGKPDLIESQHAIKVQEYSDEEDEREHRQRMSSEQHQGLPVDIMPIVMSLRKQRNRGMVQNEEQYNFIYRAVMDELANQKIELSPAVLEFMQSSMKVSNDVGVVPAAGAQHSRSPANSLGVVRSNSKGLSKSAEYSKPSEPMSESASPPFGGFVSARLPRKPHGISQISPSSMEISAVSPPATAPALFSEDRMDVDNPLEDSQGERDMSEGDEEEEYDSDLSDEDDWLYQSRGNRRKSRRAVRRAAPGADWRHQSMGIPPPPAPGSPPYTSGLPPELQLPGLPPTNQFASMQL
eukprot:TRINITY_DN6612_c0_g1_i1.p1 TRINITY_DN6612_c0_g1~~TRINITY_DN6612_c0_g1_i1.p1  ORF type:complete len:618 (+),score=75.23 TRINITY_DN6612_c0_g1_i1:84-1937(+)